MKYLPIHEWPEVDRKAWNAALHSGSILDDPGALSHLRAATIARRMYIYGRWLRYLFSQDMLEPGASGVLPLCSDLFRRYVAMLRANFAPRTVAETVDELGRLACLFQPEKNWKFVQTTARRLHRQAKLVKGTQKLSISSTALYRLGLRLMNDAEARPTPVGRARQFRAGLVISFLAARPLRTQNLTMITLNRHLQLRGDTYWIHFEPEET
jgi:integrase/recombinase XerD